jgi:hypothetical protein
LTDVSVVRTASIIRAMMMEVVRISEMSVYINDNTRRYIPECYNLSMFSIVEIITFGKYEVCFKMVTIKGLSDFNDNPN